MERTMSPVESRADGKAKSVPQHSFSRIAPADVVESLSSPLVSSIDSVPIEHASGFRSFNIGRVSIYAPKPVYVQRKPILGAPDDRYEREADRVADKVVAANEPPVREHHGGTSKAGTVALKPRDTSCAADVLIEPQEQEEQQVLVQRKLRLGTPADVNDRALSALHKISDSGVPLSPRVRKYFEPRFEHDFSHIRIHTGGNASQAARLLNAQAFTYGNHIAFAGGKFRPNSEPGRWLLAHELTHTIQQGHGRQKSIQQLARGARRSSGTDGQEIEDTIPAIELALSVAEPRLEDETIPEAHLTRIRSLYENLRSILPALRAARGTDGSGVEIGFDTDPAANEINPGDASRSIEELYYPFSIDDPSTLAVAQPASSEERPSVQAKAVQGVAISALSAPAIQRICVPCLGLIVLGGLLLAGCRTRSSGAIGLDRLRQARGNFNSNNSQLTDAEKRKIHEALAVTVGRNADQTEEQDPVGRNINLRIAFYDYFSNRQIRKATAAELATPDWTRSPPPGEEGETEVLARASENSDMVLRPRVLQDGFDNGLLGALLLHEYTHTHHPVAPIGFNGAQEGEAYGVEFFFAERNRQTDRMGVIGGFYHHPGRVTSGSFNQTAFRENFRKFYLVLKVLYDVIENQGTRIESARSSTDDAALTVNALRPNEARELSTELITTRWMSRSDRLNQVIQFSETAVLDPIRFEIPDRPPEAASEETPSEAS